jgi:hypothetical protein
VLVANKAEADNPSVAFCCSSILKRTHYCKVGEGRDPLLPLLVLAVLSSTEASGAIGLEGLVANKAEADNTGSKRGFLMLFYSEKDPLLHDRMHIGEGRDPFFLLKCLRCSLPAHHAPLPPPAMLLIYHLPCSSPATHRDPRSSHASSSPVSRSPNQPCPPSTRDRGGTPPPGQPLP